MSVILVFLHASCSLNPETDEQESTSEQTFENNPTAPIEEPAETEPMYKTYILDDETLVSAELPIVSVTTEKNKKIESKENWIPATMK